MKKFISLFLILSLIISISVPNTSFAFSDVSEEVLYSEYDIQTGNYEELIKTQGTYIYSKKDESSVISFTVKGGKLIDFGYNDYSGVIKTISDVPYSLNEYTIYANSNNIMVCMREIAHLIKTNSVPSKLVDQEVLRLFKVN